MTGYPAAQAHIQEADLAVEGTATTVVDETAARFGRIDVVVASAGTSEPSDIGRYDPAVWERQRRINLDSVMELAAASVPT